MEKVLEVKELKVIRNGRIVIDGAEFEVLKGDYIGIIGPNGGGKTTLLLAILGRIPRISGSIKWFGKELKDFKDWHRIAFIPQDATNFDRNFPLSVKEFVVLGRLGRKAGRKINREDWEEVDLALEFMGLAEVANKRIGELSEGQKQRMFVARALVRKPEVLILDEPIAGMDASIQEKFYQKMSELNHKMNVTILMVSHDLSVVFCKMNKVICVNKEVYVAKVGKEAEEVLRKAYGEHFYFVFHRHECRGEFVD
ncbi:MAG: metal ABC transporter ATP-binding protein [Candidatus Methanomethyliaceae archaeon]|nr:metal ABC transporter ATP-binding protein [Candidatus Methanomethyliaceae archaeon]MDW7970980.1 metal ABC transporter ATP-binding protein [Nitrososphaerota archaeon]